MRANPVVFWDVFGKRGFPVRATISDLGPLLLGRLFNLNATQQGVLALVFKVADDNGLLLLDLKDLRAMLQFVGDNAAQFTTKYGNVSAASIGAIQRALLEVEQQGGDTFFGEPMLDIDDLLQTDAPGPRHGQRPRRRRADSLAEALRDLPAVDAVGAVRAAARGRRSRQADAGVLLRRSAPAVQRRAAALLEKIEQVVRLIRSKGVGVYFVTQSPADVPDIVLGQLGNRVQHALRAFTPRDQKAVKTAADTLRPNPKLDIGRAITELAVGEALVSMLDEKGSPTVTERAWIVPPASRIGPITDAERAAVREQTKSLYGHYEQAVDRESAYEKLKARSGREAAGAGRDGRERQVGRAAIGRDGASRTVAVGRLGDHRCLLGDPASAPPVRAADITTAWCSRRRRARRARSAPASAARFSAARSARFSAAVVFVVSCLRGQIRKKPHDLVFGPVAIVSRPTARPTKPQWPPCSLTRRSMCGLPVTLGS